VCERSSTASGKPAVAEQDKQMTTIGISREQVPTCDRDIALVKTVDQVLRPGVVMVVGRHL